MNKTKETHEEIKGKAESEKEISIEETRFLSGFHKLLTKSKEKVSLSNK